MGTLWIDIEDLYVHAANRGGVTGIQRVVIETSRALLRLQTAQLSLRFVRHNALRDTFTVVPDRAAYAIFDRLTAASNRDGKPSSEVPNFAPEMSLHRLARRAVNLLPAEVGRPLSRATRQQADALKSFAEFGRAIAASLAVRSRTSSLRGTIPNSSGEFAETANATDVLLALGAPWSHPNYGAIIERVKRRYGLRFGLFVHDLLPVRWPEFFPPAIARNFEHWYEAVLPHADVVMTFSNATAEDVAAFAARKRVSPAPMIRRISAGASALSTGPARGQSPAASVAPGDYVLCVSTIEARKNHALLFRVWRRMLNDMPAAAVPQLVLAGRFGWLTDDLLHQMRNTAFLGGKISLLQGTSDSELARLYRGCLFTVFPSFCEGWGLPVVESLSFGRPCFASRIPSVIEAGGRFVKYFDPDCASEAHEMIVKAITSPEHLRAWEQEIADGYTPSSWGETARSLIDSLLE